MRSKFLSLVLLIALGAGLDACKKDNDKPHYDYFTVNSVTLRAVDWYDPSGAMYSPTGSYTGQFSLTMFGFPAVTSETIPLTFKDSSQFPKYWYPVCGKVRLDAVNTFTLYSVESSPYVPVVSYSFSGSSGAFVNYPAVVSLKSRNTVVELGLTWY